ncbi:glycosyltransferase family 9 protein [Arthrobacter crystallopoietes]|uniref:glycosyltransferase family 9 protein n=1 Tax=Crystallibacter crystallopoietes TaxID=37928 RepID=UPI001ABDCF9A|nr:glycosyltransferase family 9 protein [Arthrobacter crystallopoietes]QTG81176.1 glycosyltransferase family 9 protein [Arthrobacter crystallopoietes]
MEQEIDVDQVSTGGADFGGERLDATAGQGLIGPLLGRFDGVKKIAVLRGGGLGDLMFAVPAMQSLAAAYPEATITLLGAPLHAALLGGRPGPVDRVEALPFAEGVRPGPEDPAAVEEFLARMREERFDLAVQLHGGGRFSNPFLLQLEARHTVGTRTEDAAALERTIPYLYYQHEVLRALEVVGLAGAAPVALQPQLTVLPEEETAAAGLLDAGRPSLVTIHPGASDQRRQWPPSYFAQVAAWAAQDGCQVLLVGGSEDVDLADNVVAQAQELMHDAGSIRSVAGRLGLGELAALLRASDVMLGNDSGPRHLAQAVGTPTVGIYWAGNLIMAGALGRTVHRVHMSWMTHCPVCGSDVTQVGWTAERCEHEFPLTEQIRPEDVYSDVRQLRATSLLLRGK